MTKVELYIDTLKKLQIDVKSHTAEIPCQLITEALYEAIKALQALASPLNAVIIPDKATNGDMIKAMFPNLECVGERADTKSYILEPDDLFSPKLIAFNGWWNAPYEGGKKDE